jgi:hypothetical protein
LKNKILDFSVDFYRLASIGLATGEPADVLALQLLSPSAFLIINIMQLYYFHSGWMELITMPRSIIDK